MPKRDRPRVVFRWRVLLPAGLALAAFAVVALLWAAAQGGLTGPLTRWLSAQLGRAVVAEGGVRIRLGGVTRVTASGLRLANSPWGARADMLLARKLTIEVDTRSLFQDTVIVRSLAVEGLDLLLERRASGENNWDFHLPPHKASAGLPLIVERASMPAATIRFTGPRLNRPLDVLADSVEQRLGDGQMLELGVHGHANGTPLDLQTSVGPLANLIAAKGILLRVEGTVGEIGLKVGGHIDSMAAPADTEMTLELQAPNAAYLASTLGARNLGDGPVALDARISPVAGDGGIQGQVSGRIGEFDLKAQGSLAKGAHLDRFTVGAQIAGPDLSLVGGLIGVNRLPVEPFKLRTELQRTGEWLSIQSATLELGAGRLALAGTLRTGGKRVGSHLEFTASGPKLAALSNRLRGAEWAKGPFDATGTVRWPQQGGTELQAELKTALGQLSVAGPIGAAPEYYGTRLSAAASGPDFAPLGRALKLPAPPEGAYQCEGSLEWNRAGIALRGVRAVIAGDVLTLDGTLARPHYAQRADLSVGLTGSNAARLAARLGVSGFPSEAYRIEGHIQRRDDRTVFRALRAITSSLTLQLDGTLGDAPAWQATDLGFTASGPALARFNGWVPGTALPSTAFRATGRLQATGNRLVVRPMQVDATGTHATISAEIALPLDSAAGHFELDARGPDLALLLPGIKAAPMVGKNFQVSAAGAWLKKQWSLERLRVSGDNGKLTVEGNVLLAPRFSAKAVQAEAHTPSLRKLGQSSDREWPDQPLDIKGRFSVSDTTASAEDLVGQLGRSDFAGRIAARDLKAKPVFEVRLESKLLDLDPFKSEAPATTQATALPAAKEPRASKGFVIPETELTLRAPKGFAGSLMLRARELHLYQQVFRDLNIQATLRDNRVVVDPLELSATDGQIKLRADLAAEGKGVLAHLAGTGKNLRIQFVPFGVGRPDATVYTADVDLRGSGATLREFAASLNGRVRLLGRGGRMASSGFLVRSNDFIKQLISVVNPIAVSQPTTEIICTAILLKATDGVLTTDPALVMRTAELDVLSNGTLDLSTERLDLNFRTAARKGVGIGMAQLINPYIKVNGTLSNPGIALDSKGALVNGGAAVATAGLSILATTVWDRVVHERDPCGAAAAQAGEREAR